MLVAALLLLAMGGEPATAPLTIDAVAGVYKHRFPNALVDGHEYTSEDVLEVVKVAPTSAYVRAETNFFNGHVCGLSGVFELQGPDLVFHDPQPPTPGEPPCVMRLHIVKGELQFDDGEGTCKSYCGARGSWGGEDFRLSARRRIRYLPRLRASSDFKDALAAHAKAARPSP